MGVEKQGRSSFWVDDQEHKEKNKNNSQKPVHILQETSPTI